jgi:hypothetical protein
MKDAVFGEGLDPLKTTRLDVFAFIGAFLAGITSYLLLRWAGYGQFWQTVAIVICLVAYAIAVARVPRLRVRLDQAGDNAYYLGLLFTLSSMAFALYDFGQKIEAGADEESTAVILSNFGIALASTIVGIFLRVVLHQMRVDPADVESMTRIELAEAATRVKGTLDSISVEMGRFHDDIRQRTQDVVSDLTAKVQSVLHEFADSVNSTMTAVLEKSGEAQVSIAESSVEVVARMQTTAAAAEEAIGQLRKVEPPPLKLAQRLDNVTGSLEGVGGQLAGLSEGVKKLADEGAAATTKLAKSVEEIRRLAAEDRRLHNEAVERLRNATDEVTIALQKVGVSLQADVEVLKTLEEQSKQSATLVAESHRATNEVLGALTNSARAVTSAIREQVEG